jgi:hypothetical protein
MLQLLILSILNIFHPFYVSVTEIEQNQKTKAVQVSVRIFYDDLEKTLNAEYKAAINISKPEDRKKVDQVIENYLKVHLKIKANGKPLALKFVGYEIEEDAAWCYLETTPLPPVQNFNIVNDILFEAHPSQSNMIHAIVNGQRKSYKLDNPSATTTITF